MYVIAKNRGGSAKPDSMIVGGRGRNTPVADDVESLLANGRKAEAPRRPPEYQFFEAVIVPPALHERFRRCRLNGCTEARAGRLVQVVHRRDTRAARRPLRGLAERRMALPNFTENRLGAMGPQPHIPTTELKAAFGSSDVRSAALEKE